MLNKIFLNKYCGCIIQSLEKLTGDFNKYQLFLNQYTMMQKYIRKSQRIIESSDFMKEMQTEFKKLMCEGQKKNLLKVFADNSNLQKFLDNTSTSTDPCKNALNYINTIIQSYETNYKSIANFFFQKKKNIPRFFLLSNDDLSEIFQEGENNPVKEKMIYKLYPWIKVIEIGEDNDDSLKIVTKDEERMELKYSKNKDLKELIEFLDTFLVKLLKDIFKNFKKEYEAALKKGNKKPKDVIRELILNKDNLAQGIFNSMLYYNMDCLEKSLHNQDEAFDKLFDLYNEIKEEKITDFVNLLNDRVPEIQSNVLQKRILINIISLENYIKTVIENLIREDVTTSTDFNFVKLVNVKFESETYILKFLTFNLEYGYEYVGLQNNFLILPETDRTYISFANAIAFKQVFQLYGINETGKKELLKIFANICGKRINYINATENFSVQAFNNYFFGNLKNGSWLCIDNCEIIKKEFLEILSNRIIEIYRIFHTGIEDDNFVQDGEKYACGATKPTIFFFYNLSFENKFRGDEVPKTVKNYYRQIALPKINLRVFLQETLINLDIEKPQENTNRIFYILNYIFVKVKEMKNSNIQFMFIQKIIDALSKRKIDIACNNSKNNNIINTNEINNENNEEKNNSSNSKDLLLFLRNFIKKMFENIMSPTEREDLRKFLNEVFDMKEYTEDISSQQNHLSSINQEDEDPLVLETIKKLLTSLKINSTNYESQIYFLYTSLYHFNSFVLVGPPLSGKSNLMGLINKISDHLNSVDKKKYNKIINVRIFTKSKTPDELFYENKQERAYRFNNNYFYNMLSLFDEENDKLVEKLNSHYNSSLTYKAPEVEEELTPEILEKMFKKTIEEEHDDEEGIIGDFNGIGGSSKEKKEEKIKILILDGPIDDTWIGYINNIYDKDNMLTLANGDKINFRNEYKLFYETAHLRNTPPSFITRQILIPCTYDNYSWEAILYTWVESNPKVTENQVLKNYIRGLFDNYFPKIYDFISHNKLKNVDLSANYSMKSLITVFDSIFPMFNFEDIKIGRKNYNVTPKIELIKKCTMSIFIFSCAWTMNLLSNFVIKTKIEKLISDVFKADDLKGPIFDYYIDENSNDFELWTNLLKEEKYQFNIGEKNKLFNYGKIFIHTNETIPYTWLCEKMIDMNFSFYLNGKSMTGKSFLLSTLINQKEDDVEIRKLKYVTSYYTTPKELEDYIFKNVTAIKRDLFGDKFAKETCLFVDDLNMNIIKDKYGTSNLLEYLRGLTGTRFAYDSRNNENRFLNKFNIIGCGNLTAYPYDDEFNRLIQQFLIMTYVVNDDYYLGVFKPSLEFKLRQYIPNTSSITSSQYIQVLLKLNQSLKGVVKQTPNKLHVNFNIKDTINIIQSFHFFTFKGNNTEYPEYLKKLFFYESSNFYENKLNMEEDLENFREKLIEAYNSVFKQDKTKIEDIFNKEWLSNNSYCFCKDYNNFNKDNEENLNEHCYLNKKRTLLDYISSKIDFFYRSKDITDKNYFKVTDENVLTVIKILRILENNIPNMILLGHAWTAIPSLLNLATFLSGVNIFDIETTFNGNTVKTKENFIDEVISPFLVKCAQLNKKSILYITPYITATFVNEVINKLMDTAEITQNFPQFLNSKEYGTIDEKDAKEALEKNIGFCYEIVPNSEKYLDLFIKYPNIIKNSNVIYLHSWDLNNLKSYFGISTKDIEFKDRQISEKIPELLHKIFEFAKILYQNYSKKTGIELYLDQKNFCTVCEFYGLKYKEYKNILEEKQKKYNQAIEIVPRIKKVLENIEKDISSTIPIKQDFERQIENQKNIFNNKTKEKNRIREINLKEGGKISQKDKKRKDLQEQLDKILSPLLEKINKKQDDLMKINPVDITEIKNTWDSFTLGKFILLKVFELQGEGGVVITEWDRIKKSLDKDVLIRLAKRKPTDPGEKKFQEITRDIVNYPEFNSGGQNKFQKSKVCNILCEFFTACNKYFIEVANQKKVYDEIAKLTGDINEYDKIKKQLINDANKVDDEFTKINNTMNDLEQKKKNLVDNLINLDHSKKCYLEFSEISDRKIEIWKNKKLIIDTMLYNYDFYLLVISAYLVFAPPLNKGYRKQFKSFLFSLSKSNYLNLSNVKELTICGMMLELLDKIGKDQEFCSSVVKYSEFLADNFIMIYIMGQAFKDKIPYLIDTRRMSIEVIRKFYEDQKTVINSTYNDLNETGDMFEKLEQAMKNGNLLFIDQCEQNIYDLLINLINNRASYNAKTKRKCYLIRNKKIDRHENFNVYFIKSKFCSKISPKAFSDCYVVNFNCPSDDISQIISDRLCLEQNPESYNKVQKFKADKKRGEFKILEIEAKILEDMKQFDLSGKMENLEKNGQVLDQYKVDVNAYDEKFKEINIIKKRLNYVETELFRFQGISLDSSQIYKWLYQFFYQDIFYAFPIEFLAELVKEFFRGKYGIYSDKNNLGKKNKIIKENVLEEDADNSESKVDFEEGVDSEEVNEENESEGDAERGEFGSEVNLKKVGGADIPCYSTKDDIIDFILFLYKKINQIFDATKRPLVLLFLLFYGLKKTEEISANYKAILRISYKIFFNNNNINIDREHYQFKSPCNNIKDDEWNALKQINDQSSYIFTLILDHIEKHGKEWEIFLEDDEGLINTGFSLLDEDLDASLTPFIKFLFFALIKPHLGESLINSIIKEIILKNEENKELQKEKDDEIPSIESKSKVKKSTNIHEGNTLEKLISENLSVKRRPILFFDNEGSLSLEKEIKENHIKKIKGNNVNSNNNNNDNNSSNQGGGGDNNAPTNTGGGGVSFKEIIPQKTELTNNEMDILKVAMKIGGIVVIKNCQLIKESMIKIFEEINDKNNSINDNFKLIFVVKKNYLLPDFFYENCDIINRDEKMLINMKDYLIDVIKSTPNELYNKFINNENFSSSGFYFKKLYVYFVILNSILVSYTCLKSKMFRIPVNFKKSDFYDCLNNLSKYFSQGSTLTEDKVKELSNVENNNGFTYESLIKISIEIFINARIIYKEDIDNINKMLSVFFEGEVFSRDSKFLFNYNNEFIINNIDEKLYPADNNIAIINQNDSMSLGSRHQSGKNQIISALKYYIPKSALVELFEKIPNEKYYFLLSGISQEMIGINTNRHIKEFFNIIGKNIADKDEINSTIENINNELNGNNNNEQNENNNEQNSNDNNNNKDKENIVNKNKNDLEKMDIDAKKIIGILEDIKKFLPDPLNTTDANQCLFKINKFEELFNPLDECLEKEIKSNNDYIEMIEEDIHSILSMLKGDMMLIDKYLNMVINLNNNLIPIDWALNKSKTPISIDLWKTKVKNIFDRYNEWIINGFLNIYDLSIFSNVNLFMTVLPLYFQKKITNMNTNINNNNKISNQDISNNNITSDKIKLHYKITKWENDSEISESILNVIKKENLNQEFLLIKGLRLKGFECTINNNNRSYKENQSKPEGEVLPIILVTYTIEKFLLDSAQEANNENLLGEEEEEEEEEEDESKEFSVSHMEGGDGKKKEKEKEEEVKNINERTEVRMKFSDEKCERSEEHLEKSKEIKKDGVHVKSSEKTDIVKTKKVRRSVEIVMKKIKRVYKKHCKLVVPFVDKENEDVYGINEPLGYLEIKIDCTRDKQEEYFNNKKIKITIDN